MTEDRRLESIEKKLDAHGDKLDTINETLKTIAVQDEQIKNHGREIGELKQDVRIYEQKLDAACNFQASCPRGQIKFLWGMSASVCVAMLGIAYRLFAGC